MFVLQIRFGAHLQKHLYDLNVAPSYGALYLTVSDVVYKDHAELTCNGE